MTYLDLALETGRRIVTQASWDHDACSWPGADAPGAMPASPESAPGAEGALYTGSAGVGLFLAELAMLTNDPPTWRAAVGAATHARQCAEAMSPSSVGFFTGRVGIAYYLTRLAALRREEQFAAWAKNVLQRTFGLEPREDRIDVMAGAAGAIPALLRIADWIAFPEALASAHRLGDRLAETARRGPDGWSWSGGTAFCGRGLTGLAHGAAGCGYAFLELNAATRDASFRYAAEQAFAYERSTFDRVRREWPDLRNPELHEFLMTDGGLDELRSRLRGGWRPSPFVFSSSPRWCHGAAGIGLTRLRAFELLGDARLQAEATLAVGLTKRRMWTAPPGEVSLCHGAFGCCETLIDAAAVLDDPSSRALAETVVGKWTDRFRSHGRWVGADAPDDPSLMLGEAGVGHVLLRLHDATVPGVLLIRTTSETPPPIPRERPAPEAIRPAYLGTHFESTIAVFDRLQPRQPTLRGAAMTDDGTAGRRAIFLEACRRIEQESDDAVRARLLDAFALEHTHFDMESLLVDLAADLSDALAVPGWTELELRSVRFTLAPRARVVRCRWDWASWLESDGEPLPLETPDDASPRFVVYRWMNDVCVRPLGHLAGTVLDRLRTPHSIASLSREVANSVGVDEADVPLLRGRIREQIQNLYETYLIVPVCATGRRRAR